MRLNKKHYLALTGLAIILLFLATRLYHLLSIPIFTDEAIYVRWVQIFVADTHQFFIPLTDGKQPLFIWLGMPVARVVHDSLLALRLTSVLAGLCALGGLYVLTNEVFRDKRLALATSFLYVVLPFTLIYDKLALYDSLLAALAVWSLYLQVVLLRRRKWYWAVLAGGVIGAALLTKSSAFFFIYLLPFSLLLFDFKSKDRKKELAKWTGLAALTVAIALTWYSILRFSPIYPYIAVKNAVFVYPIGEWIKNPFGYFGKNIRILIHALVGYSTIPLLLLVGVAFFIEKRLTREKLLLLTWFVAPFLALAFFGKLILPRYILFMVMPLLPLAVFGGYHLLLRVKKRLVVVVMVLLLLLPLVRNDYFILADFSKAKLPPSDHKQLIEEGYTAGVGARKTVDFIQAAHPNQQVYIGTEGLFGLMPDSLQGFFNGNDRITVKGFWPINDIPPQEILQAAQVMPTYFVFYAPCSLCEDNVAPSTWNVQKVMEVSPSLNTGPPYTLYKVLP